MEFDHLMVVTVAMLAHAHFGECLIEHIPLPTGLTECFTRYREKTSIVDTVGESIASFCFGQYMWQAAREHGIPGFNISREAYTWVQGLLTNSDLRRHKRQASALRIRKEYRRLTEIERANFHRAVNMLKADTSVMPSMYDALSAIHQGIMTTAAHGGPNFLGFHRIYLMMYENALRQKIPSVTVPYWDSTLDQVLINPTQSILFTDPFMGNGFGVVRTGPFAGWTTLSGPLIRNIGQSGQLFNSGDMGRIVSSVRLAQITEPNAPVNSSLEFLHNQVHLWVDGQMGSLETASHDPIFWLHHSYVDYVWELFRNNQRRFGVDPTTDYPMFVNNSMHTAMYPMGLANFRNIDGLSDMFTSGVYRYETAPRCSVRFPDCGSPYLRCVMRGFRPVCASVDWTGASRVSPVFFGPAPFVSRSPFQRQAEMSRSTFITQAQMRMRMSQRRLLQNRMMFQVRQPARMPMGENEAFGADDPIESHVKKRSTSFMNKAYSHNKWNRVPLMPADPRGSAFGPTKMKAKSRLTAMDQPPLLLPPPTTPLPAVNVSGENNMMPPASPSCPTFPVSEGYQNTFHVNGRNDIHQWVYVPVKIIYQRPPTYSSYSSFPIVNGEIEEEDIYSPNPHVAMKNMLPVGRPASYTQCAVQNSGAGKVYISSQGLNYMGTYKEYAVVDHRLAISVATAYVAVKSPEVGATEVFLNAYDSCGRICEPFCKIRGSSRFQRCSGAFRITPTHPKLYGANYAEAVTSLWHISNGDNCPSMQDKNVYIQFHCNFRESWPFVMATRVRPQQKPMSSSTAADEAEEPEAPEIERRGSVVSGTQAQGCHLGNGCVISSWCQRCEPGDTFACIGACAFYASCEHGGYKLRSCPENTWFNPALEECVPGNCYNKNQNQWWVTGTGWK